MQKELDPVYDYAGCERIWRKVAPGENPYPEMRASAAENGRSESRQAESGQTESELSLPGAESNPCCMGTEVVESVDVLKGFVRGEIADAQQYALLAKCAPTQGARKMFRAMSADEERHAQRLLAVVYLITGERYCPHVYPEKRQCGSYCAMLRELYHEEACGGFNYLRAADETLDYCLEKIFTELSQDEYRHAGRLLDLLGRNMR